MAPRASIVLTSLALAACSVASPQPSGPNPGTREPDTTTRPDRTVKSDGGAWELRIWYRAMGTRSEGQHGVLFFEGREVPRPEVGAERDTGLGRMKYYGLLEGRMPWAPTGWNYADASQMKPSSWVDPPI